MYFAKRHMYHTYIDLSLYLLFKLASPQTGTLVPYLQERQDYFEPLGLHCKKFRL